MKLWDFGRVKDGKVKIGEKIRRRLGLEDGSQVYSTLFRYEQNGSRGHEMVLSTFGPENYRELCNLTFYMIDAPGACAQASKFLADRNVDILNSVSVSMTCGISMVWKMLVDLSYYGDSTQLMEDFASLRRTSPAALSKVEGLEINHSHISDRYTKGMTGPTSGRIKVKPLRKVARSPSLISDGNFTIPKDYLEHLDDVKEGTPVMMVGDVDSWVLSMSFLPQDCQLAEISFEIPDKPGAIYKATEALAAQEVNLLAVQSRVVVYGQRMALDLVADLHKAGDLDQVVSKALGSLGGDFKLRSKGPVTF
jgi:predicted amino acid-binding ACT domain protein